MALSPWHAHISAISAPNPVLTIPPPARNSAGNPEPARSNRTGHHESRQSTRKPRPGGLAGFFGPRLRRQGRPQEADRYRRRQRRYVESIDLRKGDRQFRRI